MDSSFASHRQGRYDREKCQNVTAVRFALKRDSVNRRSFLEDRAMRLFDLRRIMIGVCITAAAYAIVQVSQAHGSEVAPTTASRRLPKNR